MTRWERTLSTEYRAIRWIWRRKCACVLREMQRQQYRTALVTSNHFIPPVFLFILRNHPRARLVLTPAVFYHARETQIAARLQHDISEIPLCYQCASSYLVQWKLERIQHHVLIGVLFTLTVAKVRVTQWNVWTYASHLNLHTRRGSEIQEVYLNELCILKVVNNISSKRVSDSNCEWPARAVLIVYESDALPEVVWIKFLNDGST